MSKAETTRLIILQKAFELIYRNGYQATSIDDIIATTQVTKGAFFYHFKNKDEMGLAVIKEVMHPGLHAFLIQPLIHAKASTSELYSMMKNVLLRAPVFQVKYGCPAVNLIEEMSPLSPSFNTALSKLVIQWQEAIQESVRQGKASGEIRKNVDPNQVAHFIISGYSGIRNMGKVFGSSCYSVYLKELKNYLKSLT